MDFTSIKTFLQKIAPLAGLDSNALQLLSTPQYVHKATLSVNGKSYPAYRVQWNNARGPFKGGIRFHPEVSEGEVKALAFWMSLKTAIADIPLGGGKGGITVNPKELSTEEIEQLSRAYIQAFHEFIGPEKDIPAPDVYTNPQIMAWMRDEYEKITHTTAPGVITGKPLDKGGSLVRDIATALGGVYVLEEAEKKLSLNKKTVAIHGFGNAGMNVASLLAAEGFTIVAASDSKGAIYNPQGLDIEKLTDVKCQTGSVQFYDGAQKITNEELLEVECEVLIPSSLSGIITQDNAARIKAKIVLELANGPTTHEADEILHKNNVFVIPDILANAGGVTVSYFEWYQNQHNEKWQEDEIKHKLKDKMSAAFCAIWDHYKPEQYDFRTAAYIHALQMIVLAEEQRGNLKNTTSESKPVSAETNLQSVPQPTGPIVVESPPQMEAQEEESSTSFNDDF